MIKGAPTLVWKCIIKRIGGFCWSIFKKFLKKIKGVGIRAAISSMLVISLLFLVIGLVFVVAPEKVCGVVGNFINILVGKTIVFQVAGALLLFFSGFINCVAFTIYGEKMGEDKFDKMQEDKESSDKLKSDNERLQSKINDQNDRIKDLEAKNKKNEAQISEMERERYNFNLGAIRMVKQLTLAELDFDILHVEHEEVEKGQDPKSSMSINRLNKYKKWFRFGYVNTRFKKSFGVDLKNLKFAINKNDKKIWVYGVEVDSTGVRDEKVLDKIFFDIKNILQKKDSSHENGFLEDDASKKVRELEKKRYDVIESGKEEYEYRVAHDDDGVIKFRSDGLGNFEERVRENISIRKNSSCSKEFDTAAKICRDQFEIILNLLLAPMKCKIEIADCKKEVPPQLMSFDELQKDFERQFCEPMVDSLRDNIKQEVQALEDFDIDD